MRHAFTGALSRVFVFTVLVLALAVPLAAHAQDVTATSLTGATLTTGIPWLDKTLVVLAAIGSICSLLSHFVSADSIPGKLISWAALNFGKELRAKPSTNLQPRGYARLGALIFIALASVLLIKCSLIKSEFGPTLAADELNCETSEIAPLRDALVPAAEAAVQKAIASAIGGDVSGAVTTGLAFLEAAVKTALGDQWTAVLCAEQVAVSGYELAHASDGGVPASGLVAMTFDVSLPEAAAYNAVKAHLAAQPKHPKQ